MKMFFQSIFAAKLLTDEREPALTFALPCLHWKFGLLAPEWNFWCQLAVLLVLQSSISAILAAITYKIVVQNRGTMEAYLFGYGIIIPISTLLPFKILKLLDLRNKCLTLSMCTLPNLVIFRCMETMHNCSPPEVETSLKNYCLYYASIIEFAFDPQAGRPRKITRSECWSNLAKLCCQILFLCLASSLLLPYDFSPFDSRAAHEARTFGQTIFEMIQPGHLANNFFAAILTFFNLNVSMGMFAICLNLAGLKTVDIMKDPLLRSSSPSNFWGQRWNQAVQGGLKRGVFKPIRKIFPKSFAVIATFVASGLLHEYIWSVLFYVHDDRLDENGLCETCFYPTHGSPTLFFVWNAFVIILEYLIGGLWIFKWISRNVPKPIITLLVISTALPMTHWFTGDWVKGGYFKDYTIGLPLIVRID